MGMALLALILVSALVILQWALAGSLRQQGQTRAAFFAQQQMETLLAEDEPKSTQGSLGSAYHWKAQVSPEGDYFRVDLTVTGPRGASFTLSSERRKQLRTLAYRNQQGLFETAEDMPMAVSLEPAISSEYSLSPDGLTIAYVSQRKIFLKKLHSSEPPQLLVEHPEGAREPRFSPDGKQLAFTSQENGTSQVFVYNLARRSWANRSHNQEQDSSPSWFPDSKSLLICRNGSSIVEHKANNSEQVWVPESSGWNTAPQTDGETLVFMSSREGTPDIYAMEMRSRQLRRLTEGPAYDNFPQIRGSRVLFQSNRDGGARIYSMNLDGSELAPVTAADQVAENPQWAR